MVLCPLLSAFGYSTSNLLSFQQPVSTVTGFSVSRQLRQLSGRSNKKCVAIATKSGEESDFGGEGWECAAETVSKSRRNVEICRPTNPGAAAQSRFLSNVGFMSFSPALGVTMLASSAVALEINPASSTMELDPGFHVELLRGFAFIADLDPGTAQLITTFLGPVIAIFNLLFIFRIVMSWYPGIPVKKFPFYIAYNPTEPVLFLTRRLIPPVGGVDVSPVIWVAFMSFANEILLGKQGLLVLLSQQQT